MKGRPIGGSLKVFYDFQVKPGGEPYEDVLCRLDVHQASIVIVVLNGAGRVVLAIPVKFSLNGDKGLNIFAAAFPVSQQLTCSDGAPISTVEETVTAGNSSISYDAMTDLYKYVWKTDKTWKGTCRQLIVKLNDSSVHAANFQFR